MKVRDVMTPEVISVGTDTQFREIVHILTENRISGVPVIGERGVVLGVVTEADLVVKEHRSEHVYPHSPAAVGGDADADYTRRLHGSVAGEIMTTPAVTVEPDADLRVAARLLSLHGIGRVPVTRAGRLVGVLSRADVLKAFFRPDGEIRAEIRALLDDRIVADTSGVSVDVDDGIVRLAGTVRYLSTAKLIAFHVDRVDGVTKVVDAIGHAVDDIRRPPVQPPPIGPLEQVL